MFMVIRLKGKLAVKKTDFMESKHILRCLGTYTTTSPQICIKSPENSCWRAFPTGITTSATEALFKYRVFQCNTYLFHMRKLERFTFSQQTRLKTLFSLLCCRHCILDQSAQKVYAKRLFLKKSTQSFFARFDLMPEPC